MADTTTQQNWQILWQALTADVTDFDASTTKHGFEPKGPGDVTKFRRSDNTWAVPPYPATTKNVWDFTVAGLAVQTIDTSADGGLTLNGNADHDYIFQVDYVYATTNTIALALYINNDMTAAHYTGHYVLAGANNVLSDANIINSLANTSTYGATIIGTVTRRKDGFCIVNFSGYIYSAGADFQLDGHFIKTVTETNITQLTFKTTAASEIGVNTRVQIWNRT